MPNKFVDASGVKKIHKLVQAELISAVETKQDIIDDLEEIRENAADVVNKQDNINDLDTIRTGAGLGATSVQESARLTDIDIEDIWNPTPPRKRDLITMNLDGVERLYRVLSVENGVTKVVAMFNSSNSQTFHYGIRTVTFSDGTSALRYKDSDLDVYLNETWYNTLTENAKAAIVEQDRIQDLWATYQATGTPFFHRQAYDGHAVSDCAGKSGTTSVGMRKVFALTVQEIFDYLELNSGDTMTYKSVLKMFWNDEDHNNNDNIWLSSANWKNDWTACSVDGRYGLVDMLGFDSTVEARPALCLDLSKIDYTIVERGDNNA